MLPSIAKLAKKHGIIPLKKYGQNFIFDENLCDKIVKYSTIDSSSAVLEIGPGTAGLTKAILKTEPESFTVIETDRRCFPLLEELRQYYPKLSICHGDALQVKLANIGGSAQTDGLDIVANLPYNIGTILVLNWIHEINYVKSMTVMLQKEVVDRIVAVPSTKAYGRLSVFCQIFCHVTKCFDVSPKAFYPEPKIWSSIVKLVPKGGTITNDVSNYKLYKTLEQVTQHAFSGRRKMIKTSLKNLIPNIEILLKILELDSSLRAENLYPEHYLAIARMINDT